MHASQCKVTVGRCAVREAAHVNGWVTVVRVVMEYGVWSDNHIIDDVAVSVRQRLISDALDQLDRTI
jgi:hypothetical protein